MIDVGAACLVIGFITALYAVGASLYGARRGSREAVVSSRRAFYCLAALLVAGFAILEAAYLRSDFSFALVQQNSSTDTPTFYKLTAIWSSQAGSLLLWVLVLSVFASAVLRVTRNRHREIVPYATAVLGVVAAFFLFLMLFYASPFDKLANPPAEGNGLQPLLRHPAMMIHPPVLYTGYVAFAIPFAFAIGALITRRTGADWIRSTRRFALIAWTFLGTGILLGALWSYTELGWGGYWGWDPVENAALMPWLVGTAFIHSIMVQEKRGTLRVWNMALIIGAFVLSLLGTFLVRSGILDSIHAFGASTLGRPFLIFVLALLAGSVGLLVSRAGELRSRARIESLASREAVFLVNNLLLVGLAFVIFWGTYFPLISEAIGSGKASVGPPWFERYTTPLAILLVLMTGVGPLLAWKRVSLAWLRRAFLWPIVIVALTLVVLLVASPAADSPKSLVLFCCVAFVFAAVAQEFRRGAAARRTMTGEPPPTAFVRLVARNRRRYGGYIVHVGFAVLLLGVGASSAFNDQRDARLSPGQRTKVGDYTLTYVKPTAEVLDDRARTGAPISLGAVVRLTRDGKTTTLRPSRNYYTAADGRGGPIGRFFEGEATSEVDVRWGLRRDLWLAVQPDLRALEPAIREANKLKAARDDPEARLLVVAALAERYRRAPPPAQFRAIVSPLVAWIWIGGGIVLTGALIALWPSPEATRRRLTSFAAARLGKDFSRA